jgi:hypothetical protein
MGLSNSKTKIEDDVTNDKVYNTSVPPTPNNSEDHIQPVTEEFEIINIGDNVSDANNLENLTSNGVVLKNWANFMKNNNSQETVRLLKENELLFTRVEKDRELLEKNNLLVPHLVKEVNFMNNETQTDTVINEKDDNDNDNDNKKDDKDNNDKDDEKDMKFYKDYYERKQKERNILLGTGGVLVIAGVIGGLVYYLKK